MKRTSHNLLKTKGDMQRTIYHHDKMKELNAVFLQEGGVLLIWLEGKIEAKF
jgi:hypothetical protein